MDEKKYEDNVKAQIAAIVEQASILLGDGNDFVVRLNRYQSVLSPQVDTVGDSFGEDRYDNFNPYIQDDEDDDEVEAPINTVVNADELTAAGVAEAENIINANVNEVIADIQDRLANENVFDPEYDEDEEPVVPTVAMLGSIPLADGSVAEVGSYDLIDTANNLVADYDDVDGLLHISYTRDDLNELTEDMVVNGILKHRVSKTLEDVLGPVRVLQVLPGADKHEKVAVLAIVENGPLDIRALKYEMAEYRGRFIFPVVGPVYARATVVEN